MLVVAQVEALERNRKADSERRKRRTADVAARRRRRSSCGQRIEIWMAVDGSRSTGDRVEVNDEDDDSDDELSSLPMVEVAQFVHASSL